MSTIPTQLTERQYEQYIAPSLSRATRGPSGHLADYQMFNTILYWLHTGCQWRELPVEPQPGGEKKPAIGKRCIITSPAGAEMAA